MKIQLAAGKAQHCPGENGLSLTALVQTHFFLASLYSTSFLITLPKGPDFGACPVSECPSLQGCFTTVFQGVLEVYMRVAGQISPSLKGKGIPMAKDRRD